MARETTTGGYRALLTKETGLQVPQPPAELHLHLRAGGKGCETLAAAWEQSGRVRHSCGETRWSQKQGVGGSECRKGSPRGKETKSDSALKGEARLRLAEKRACERA